MTTKNTDPREDNPRPRKPYLVVMTEYERPPNPGKEWLFGPAVFVSAENADDAMGEACDGRNTNLIPVAAWSVEQLAELLDRLKTANLLPLQPVIVDDVDDYTEALLAEAAQLIGRPNSASENDSVV